VSEEEIFARELVCELGLNFCDIKEPSSIKVNRFCGRVRYKVCENGYVEFGGDKS
jgi:hypothetical protein